ncbi:regulatory protein GntR, HTH [Alkaliphilus metalliredigens QYMF]|uniref:Regulatory protein GntR, HTH n=1 Tax=Alkaliphilus metalliredigens (strain QYMF) TaxID=293826 RepID=A6TTM7_ALKMQ|nr:winged helix-turn-helix domain-containing protein [Alkaliphilus metalliredigens]ABR49545.1 regulatory protein GntR, HTH [Alkaliphilus metalliredigens QYMF]
MKIDKQSGVPIYIQIKNTIMDDIKDGTLKIGDKLPTERELSQKMNVSRNTISSAYKLLEREGVLVSYQGRGTFVGEEEQTWKQHNIKDKVFRMIDLALEEAIETGFDTKEFISIVKERVKEKEAVIKNMNALFVECNIEQARYFAKELSKITDINVLPMTIAELQSRNQTNEQLLKEAQIIITTFNHINQVKNLIVDQQKEVCGVAINPSLETIVKIAKYPKKTKFGQICLSKEFQFKVQYALESAGLDNLEMMCSVSQEEEEVLKVIDASDVIIVSPGRKESIRQLVKGKKDVIGFDYFLDQYSVKAIISKVIEIKRHL